MRLQNTTFISFLDDYFHQPTISSDENAMIVKLNDFRNVASYSFRVVNIVIVVVTTKTTANFAVLNPKPLYRTHTLTATYRRQFTVSRFQNDIVSVISSRFGLIINIQVLMARLIYWRGEMAHVLEPKLFVTAMVRCVTLRRIGGE